MKVKINYNLMKDPTVPINSLFPVGSFVAPSNFFHKKSLKLVISIIDLVSINQTNENYFTTTYTYEMISLSWYDHKMTNHKLQHI